MGRVEWTARWTKDLMDSVWTGGLCVDRWNSAVARRQPYLWRYGFCLTTAELVTGPALRATGAWSECCDIV